MTSVFQSYSIMMVVSTTPDTVNENRIGLKTSFAAKAEQIAKDTHTKAERCKTGKNGY